MDMIPDEVKDWVSFILTQSPSWLTPIYRAVMTIRSLFMPLINRLATSPDIASIVLLVVVLFISLQILNMLRRAVVFWITLGLRIFFWGGIAIFVLHAYNRGLDGAIVDIAEFWGFFMGQYQYYQEQAASARGERQMRDPYEQYGGIRNERRRRDGWR